jgi:hypothetical protein
MTHRKDNLHSGTLALNLKALRMWDAAAETLVKNEDLSHLSWSSHAIPHGSATDAQQHCIAFEFASINSSN